MMVIKTSLPHFGECGHDLYLRTLLELASIVRKKGDIAGSKAMYEEVRKNCEEYFGSDHVLTVKAEHGFAICLLKERNFNAAEKKLEEVLKIRENFGKHQPAYLRTLGFLGECKFQQGRPEACLDLFREAIRLMMVNREVFHERHESIIKSIIYILKSLGDQNKDERLKTLRAVVNGDDYFLCEVLKNIVQNSDHDIAGDIDVKYHLLQVLESLLRERDEVDEQITKLIRQTETEMPKQSRA
ncbi:Kinesin light chain 4 [Folsomia candida]|uniref:Kinesin light chain 4 n=1 Tax=Folsomia candida TaxID=158441 RepID=A0A226E8S0_FOLCA|nr:Kinesin light chain 4 [Folsomia candida]